jgi:hypothetical protein
MAMSARRQAATSTLISIRSEARMGLNSSSRLTSVLALRLLVRTPRGFPTLTRSTRVGTRCRPRGIADFWLTGKKENSNNGISIQGSSSDHTIIEHTTGSTLSFGAVGNLRFGSSCGSVQFMAGYFNSTP